MKKTRMSFILPIMFMLMLMSIASFAEGENIAFVSGDVIQFGTYNDKPILWLVTGSDTSGNINVVSKNIISVKAFDAAGDSKEKDDFYSYALHYGSNNWEESTLRKWLNTSDRKIEWQSNAPSIENIFNGENGYEKESGFLAKDNFNSEEIMAISQTAYKNKNEEIMSDKVYLLTSKETIALIDDALFYPLLQPTYESIAKSDYKGWDLKLGKTFSVWTRDSADNPFAKHSVKTISGDGTEQVGVACAGRYGIMPAMTLDGQVLSKHLTVGDGSTSNPYRFSFKQGLNIKLWLLVFVIISAISVLLIILLKRHHYKKVKIGVALFLILLGLITMTQFLLKASYAEFSDSDTDDYLVVQNYALNKDFILQRIDELIPHGKAIVVDSHGNDVTADFVSKHVDVDDLSEKNRLIEELYEGGGHLLYPGDFRVTHFKKEVEGVFNGTHYIVKIEGADYQVVDSSELTDEFVRVTREHYMEKDYASIKAYLDQKHLTIRHPSDTSNTGIPLLYIQ